MRRFRSLMISSWKALSIPGRARGELLPGFSRDMEYRPSSAPKRTNWKYKPLLSDTADTTYKGGKNGGGVAGKGGGEGGVRPGHTTYDTDPLHKISWTIIVEHYSTGWLSSALSSCKINTRTHFIGGIWRRLLSSVYMNLFHSYLVIQQLCAIDVEAFSFLQM